MISKIETTCYHSPLGWIEIKTAFGVITSLMFCNEQNNAQNSSSPILAECVHQIDEYFAGRRMNFDVPVRQKGTEFQQKVWKTLTDIPFGKTVSYGDVAKMMGCPKSVRAVGAANGQNKIWIIVPCHRVIGANGSLTGYAGGLERKKWLLDHEKSLVVSR